MCVWIHPDKRELSTVIASDKSAGRVFVYDLDGQVLQTISIPKPGNIDIRQGVSLNGQATDLVVVNQRTDGFKLVAFRVQILKLANSTASTIIAKRCRTMAGACFTVQRPKSYISSVPRKAGPSNNLN